jgi:hypothetical protein
MLTRCRSRLSPPQGARLAALTERAMKIDAIASTVPHL